MSLLLMLRCLSCGRRKPLLRRGRRSLTIHTPIKLSPWTVGRWRKKVPTAHRLNNLRLRPPDYRDRRHRTQQEHKRDPVERIPAPEPDASASVVVRCSRGLSGPTHWPSVTSGRARRSPTRSSNQWTSCTLVNGNGEEARYASFFDQNSRFHSRLKMARVFWQIFPRDSGPFEMIFPTAESQHRVPPRGRGLMDASGAQA